MIATLIILIPDCVEEKRAALIQKITGMDQILLTDFNEMQQSAFHFGFNLIRFIYLYPDAYSVSMFKYWSHQTRHDSAHQIQSCVKNNSLQRVLGYILARMRVEQSGVEVGQAQHQRLYLREYWAQSHHPIHTLLSELAVKNPFLAADIMVSVTLPEYQACSSDEELTGKIASCIKFWSKSKSLEFWDETLVSFSTESRCKVICNGWAQIQAGLSSLK